MRPAFVSAIPLIVSVVFIWIGWGYYSKEQAAKSWTEAKGTIIESKVVGTNRSKSGTSSKKMFKVGVTYDYEVGGQVHRGDQLGFMETRYSSQSRVAEEVKKYPVGETVTVYYNPADPQEACLDRSAGLVPWLMMGGGVLGMLVGGKLLMSFTKVRSRRDISDG